MSRFQMTPTGAPVATSTGNQSSGVLRSLLLADALAVIPPHTSVEVGEKARGHPPQVNKASKTKLWRISDLGDLELLRAENVTQAFPKHTHERYAVGVLERGALGFFTGARTSSPPPVTSTCAFPARFIPDSPPCPKVGATGCFTWALRCSGKLPPRSLLGRVSCRFFSRGVLHDDALARQLYGVHCRLETSASRLEQETLLLDVLAQLVSRHADDPPRVVATGREPRAVHASQELPRAPLRRGRLTRSFGSAHAAQPVTISSGFFLKPLGCRLTRISGRCGLGARKSC